MQPPAPIEPGQFIMGWLQASWHPASARKTLARALAGGLLLAAAGTGAAWGQQAANLVCSACVGSTDLANSAVTASKIGGGAVTNGKIAANAVNASKIATGAVTAPKIGPNAVNASKIATGAITAPKIGPGAVNVNKLANSAVSTAKIQVGAVTESRIADGAVTPEKLSFSAATPGDIDTLIAKIDNLAHLQTQDASAYVFVSSQTFTGNLGRRRRGGPEMPGPGRCRRPAGDLPRLACGLRSGQRPGHALHPGAERLPAAGHRIGRPSGGGRQLGRPDRRQPRPADQRHRERQSDRRADQCLVQRDRCRGAALGGQSLFRLDLDGWRRSIRVWGSYEQPMDGDCCYNSLRSHHRPNLLLRPVRRGQKCKRRHRPNQRQFIMGWLQASWHRISARKTLARALAGGLLLAAAGTGTAWGQQATNLVCSACVGSGDLANGAVTAAKIGGGAVTNGKIAANAVNASKIATGAVTAPKIGPNAVNASKIATGAITAPKIGPGAVNVNKLANSAVSTAKIQIGAITESRIADGAVTPEKLSFTAATGDDIDTLTAKIENLVHLRARGASAYVFVTSQTFTGNLGGIAGADQKCQDLADAAGLPGIYKAWLADSDPASAPAQPFHPGAQRLPAAGASDRPPPRSWPTTGPT